MTTNTTPKKLHSSCFKNFEEFKSTISESEMMRDFYDNAEKNNIRFEIKPKRHKAILSKSFFMSFFISLVFFGFLIDFQLAAILLFSIGFHEMGHLLVGKYFGLNTGGFVFLPGIGGAATVEFSNDGFSNFMAVIGGPFFGLILSLFLAGLYSFFPSEFLLEFVKWNTIINLFNLLPLGIIDGGKMLRHIVSPLPALIGFAIALCSFVGMLVFFITIVNNPVLLIFVGLFGVMEAMSEYGHFKFRYKFKEESEWLWKSIEHLEKNELNEGEKMLVSYEGVNISKPLTLLDSLFCSVLWAFVFSILVMVFAAVA